MIQNDATVLGILLLILALVFYTSHSQQPGWLRFYRIVPPILLCYFIPGILNSVGIINGSSSQLYPIVSRYFLPACLVLLIIGIDWPSLRKLGPQALILMLTGSLGILIGGPAALWIVGQFSPETVGGEGPDAVWRGMATIAGSWIGGGANMTALKEVFKPSDHLFSQIVVVEVMVSELWMAILIYSAAYHIRIDNRLKANSDHIDTIQQQLEEIDLKNHEPLTIPDMMYLAAVGFTASGLAHWLSDQIVPYLAANYPELAKYSLTSSFFWIVSLVTLFGIGLSMTPLRNLEHVGASKLGTLFLYVLVTTIGMQMDLGAVADNPGLFAVGVIWMLIHAVLIIGVARLFRIPFFFAAVGSQANVGGSASAPIVAAAFHPALAPVGVLLSILGYAIGSYAGYLSAMLMKWVSES